MKKQHTQKMTVRVTAQTAYNLERLMLMSGQKTPGRVVDKLVREKMLALRGRNIETEVKEMKLAAFNATCPFEIGDKITERREIHPTGLAFNGPVFTEVTHTITDIVCQHSVKTGEILFLYELDNSGKLVVIAAAEERRAKK